MIKIESLKASDVGRFVVFVPARGHPRLGRIQSWTDKCIYVVHGCKANWDRYKEITAVRTNPDFLQLVTPAKKKRRKRK